MNKNLLATTFYNIVVLLVFLALAILFEHWWIIFFGLLFSVSYRDTTKYCRTCDSCGARSTSMDTREEALYEAIKDGWIHDEATNTDYCPKCMVNLCDVKRD